MGKREFRPHNTVCRSFGSGYRHPLTYRGIKEAEEKYKERRKIGWWSGKSIITGCMMNYTVPTTLEKQIKHEEKKSHDKGETHHRR